MAQAHDKLVRPRTFKVGDLVLVLRRSIIAHRKIGGKFEPTLEGPFVVEKAYQGGSYQLIDCNGERPICSTDNIILAAELLRDFKGPNKKICAKLDVKKAFDTVSREFIIARLIQKGFPEIFVAWIKGCISDVHYSICLNGSLEGFFKSSSGLRQGCPLSSLLFCIAMDCLSNILIDPSGAPTFKGIRCKDFYINHLMYADDLLVLGESSRENATHMNNCLQLFASLSGLQINTNKSAIIFSHHDSENQNICQELGILNVNLHLTYLGIPISPKRLKVSHFQPLLSKIFALLAGWKNKFLSFAGRVQFLKFTITNSIAYWIRGSIIPKGCCTIINKLCSKFLFHNNLLERKLHLISWSNVTIPKYAGGLGIPSFDALYFGVCCSIIGRFYNNQNLLCCWFQSKYIMPWKNPPSTTSKFWHKISATVYKIKEKLSFPVSKNCNCSFLWDPWLNGKPICDTFQLPVLEAARVSDFILGNNWQLPPLIPQSLCDSIKAVNILDNTGILWEGSTKWVFRNFIQHFYSGIPKADWYISIWHKNHALKYACFTWMARIGKLKTADNLIMRGIQTWGKVFWECCFHSIMLEDTLHKISWVYRKDYNWYWRTLGLQTMMSKGSLSEPWRAPAATWLAFVDSQTQVGGTVMAAIAGIYYILCLSFGQPAPPLEFLVYAIRHILMNETCPKF
ncbi:uncharacterized protein LOC110108341 [Dendrobium catenatum]|uniref:uncharacterized protein LOC110108341 n=1 Tax=Dendrobium catenatum TaxID=906689 RepID=UPI0010A01BCD|nr:uncharacterized protein LOC110108341 [Dendrobium catenatum]